MSMADNTGLRACFIKAVVPNAFSALGSQTFKAMFERTWPFQYFFLFRQVPG